MARPKFPDGAQCPLCLGTIHPGTTNFMVDLKPGFLIVQNVPANVCSQCGEEWLEIEATETLDRLADEMHSRGSQMAVLPYPGERVAELA